MAEADKILERLLRLPPEMKVSEIETLVTSLGWTIRQGKSSHIGLIPPSNQPNTIATVKGRMIKRMYLRMIVDEIE